MQKLTNKYSLIRSLRVIGGIFFSPNINRAKYILYNRNIMKDCVEIWIGDVYCHLNMNTNEVYSAKGKKLKGLHHPHIKCPFYIIKYAGHKATKSLDQLRRLANEILQRKNS